MRFRLPLPVKVLLSYLAVLAAGAIPAFYWVQAIYPERLTERAARELAGEARAAATVLSVDELGIDRIPEGARAHLSEVAALVGDRVAVVGPSGALLFDSRPAARASAPSPPGRCAPRAEGPGRRTPSPPR